MKKSVLKYLMCLLLAATMAGCGAAVSTDESKEDTKSKVESSVAEDTESSEETTDISREESSDSMAEPEAPIETEESVATTTKPDDEKPSSSGGFSIDIDVDVPDLTPPEIPNVDDWFDDDTSSISTVALDRTETPETTTQRPVSAGSVSTLDTMIVDDTIYTMPVSECSPPSGWDIRNETDLGKYVCDKYPQTYINITSTQDGRIKSVLVSSGDLSNVPTLQLKDGITWGASADDVRTAYGEAFSDRHNDDEAMLIYQEGDVYMSLSFKNKLGGLYAVTIYII